jgi:hypothetical protein
MFSISSRLIITCPLLLRSRRTWEAHVGEHAEKWKQEGGGFAWMVTPERGPIFEGEAGSLAR